MLVFLIQYVSFLNAYGDVHKMFHTFQLRCVGPAEAAAHTAIRKLWMKTK
jgi:hypothetical protein